MPLYVATLTIPAGTPSNSPVTSTVTLYEEVLEQIIILIPPGHYALAGLRIYYGDEQLIPKPSGSWLRGDNVVIPVKMRWKLPERPTVLRLEGYNEDVKYQHSFYLYIVTSSEEEAFWWRGVKDFINSFKRLVGLK